LNHLLSVQTVVLPHTSKGNMSQLQYVQFCSNLAFTWYCSVPTSANRSHFQMPTVAHFCGQVPVHTACRRNYHMLHIVYRGDYCILWALQEGLPSYKLGRLQWGSRRFHFRAGQVQDEMELQLRILFQMKFRIVEVLIYIGLVLRAFWRDYRLSVA
jgi:hypothetical protein